MSAAVSRHEVHLEPERRELPMEIGVVSRAAWDSRRRGQTNVPIAGGSRSFVCALFQPRRGNYHMVDTTDLVDREVAPDVAFTRALNALRRRSEVPLERDRNGIFWSRWADSRHQDRLALPDLFEDLNVVGDPVVLAPVDRTILATGSLQPISLFRMILAGLELMRRGNVVSGELLQLVEGRWVPMELPDWHPAAVAAKELKERAGGAPWPAPKG